MKRYKDSGVQYIVESGGVFLQSSHTRTLGMDDRFLASMQMQGAPQAIVTRYKCTTMARGGSETCMSRGVICR
jgi:hypothetical protein